MGCAPTRKALQLPQPRPPPVFGPVVYMFFSFSARGALDRWAAAEPSVSSRTVPRQPSKLPGPQLPDGLVGGKRTSYAALLGTRFCQVTSEHNPRGTQRRLRRRLGAPRGPHLMLPRLPTHVANGLSLSGFPGFRLRRMSRIQASTYGAPSRRLLGAAAVPTKRGVRVL